MHMVSIIVSVALLTQGYQISHRCVICLATAMFVGDVVYLHQAAFLTADLTGVVVTFKHSVFQPLPFCGLITLEKVVIHINSVIVVPYFHAPP